MSKTIWLLFDSDLNKIDSISNATKVYGEAGDEVLYVKDHHLTDYFTDEIIMRNIPDDTTVYKYNDILFAVTEMANSSRPVKVSFANGKEIDTPDAGKLFFKKDITTGKLYIVVVYSDKVELYDIENALTVPGKPQLTASFDVDLTYFEPAFVICDGKFIFSDDDSTRICNIADPGSEEEIFYYSPTVFDTSD